MKKTLSVLLFCLLGNVYAQPIVNDTVCDFTVVDVHGHTHNLFTYLDSNKFVCVDFFGISCQQCIDLVPVFNNAYNNFGCNKGDLIFLAINSMNSDGEVLAFEQQQGGIYPAVSGIDGGGQAVYQEWQIQYYPQLTVIKPDKTVAANIYPINQTDIDSVFNAHSIQQDSCGSNGIVDYSSPINEFKIYPNPAKDKLIIETNQSQNLEIIFKIIDVSGKVLLSKILYQNNNSIDISMLNNGIYIVELLTSKNISKQKILIK